MISPYLPYRQISYQTDLTPVEIQQILAANVISDLVLSVQSRTTAPLAAMIFRCEKPIVP